MSFKQQFNYATNIKIFTGQGYIRTLRGDFDKSVTDKYILSYIISDNGNPKLQATYNVEGYLFKFFTDKNTLELFKL